MIQLPIVKTIDLGLLCFGPLFISWLLAFVWNLFPFSFFISHETASFGLGVSTFGVIALATTTFMEYEIILHAFCPFHHLLIGIWGFISLKDEFANPRLQDMEKRHFTQIFHLHWDKVNNSLKAWTYYTKVSSPSPWCKLNNFCPSFKISLCEVNLSFNLVLKSFQNKVSIKSNSTSYCAMHHSKTWFDNKY